MYQSCIMIADSKAFRFTEFIERDAMKILIIEDTLRHQEAAKAQMPEALVVNYNEAYEILAKAKPGQFSAILTDMYFKVEGETHLGGASYEPGYTSNPTILGSVGKEMPFGFAFALKAIELGIPVAIMSDLNHHDDFMAGMMDFFTNVENPKFVSLCDGRCEFSTSMCWDGEKIVVREVPRDDHSGEEYFHKATGVWSVKNWEYALQELRKRMKF